MKRTTPFNYVFIFIGWPKSGKKLAGQLFSHAARVTHAATSSIVYEELAKERGVRPWELESLEKDDLVPDLVRVGNALCANTPTALVAPLLKRGVRVISGVRRRVELRAARQHIRDCGLVPVIVWMDRRGVVRDNTEVGIGDADWVIRNYGSVGYLAERVAELADEFQVVEAGDAPQPEIGGDNILGLSSTASTAVADKDPAGSDDAEGFLGAFTDWQKDPEEEKKDVPPADGSSPPPNP